MVFLILYGKNGYMDNQELNYREQVILNENMEISAGNRSLERKIERLRGDLSYIEYIARHELGMLGDDELVFRFQDVVKPTGVEPSADN